MYHNLKSNWDHHKKRNTNWTYSSPSTNNEQWNNYIEFSANIFLTT